MAGSLQEKAGFKNAIANAGVAPTKQQDSTWSLEDARYSTYRVQTRLPSPTRWDLTYMTHAAASVIESHIGWYHDVFMRFLRDWYLIQASPSDPKGPQSQLR